MIRETSRLVELLLILAAAIAPIFFLATTIDADEYVKAGIGVSCAGIVHKLYEAWGKRKERIAEEEAETEQEQEHYFAE